jgi:peptide/nickel transport system permease protein
MQAELKKAIRYLLALFIIFSLNFFIPRAMPGDPITNLMGENFVVNQDRVKELKSELGLDKPLSVQYLNYWRDILRLDLGFSYLLHEQVSKVIGARILWTLALVGSSILLGAIIGIVLGALSGWESSSFFSRSSTLVTIFIYSTPPFFLALLFLYLFSFKWGIFPLKGYYETKTLADILQHFLLPVLVLAFYLGGKYFLIMRGSVLQEKNKHYVLYAKAKGIHGREILYHHIRKNAILPILTLLALDFGFIFSGALFVEIVFSLNGLGILIYEALLSRDYPVLQGCFLIITLMVVTANLLVDLIYPKFDPRLQQKA